MRWIGLLAWLPLLAGVGLLGWAGRELGWLRGLDLDDTPPDPALPRLVLYGPFRRVRHPQMLALLCLLVAAGLYWGRGMWVVVVVCGAVVVWLARRDERWMESGFGEAYARYRRAVPFLLPGWR